MAFRVNVARSGREGGDATLTMHNVARRPISRGHVTLCMTYMHNVTSVRQNRVDATLCMLATRRPHARSSFADHAAIPRGVGPAVLMPAVRLPTTRLSRGWVGPAALQASSSAADHRRACRARGSDRPPYKPAVRRPITSVYPRRRLGPPSPYKPAVRPPTTRDTPPAVRPAALQARRSQPVRLTHETPPAPPPPPRAPPGRPAPAQRTAPAAPRRPRTATFPRHSRRPETWEVSAGSWC